MPPTTTDVVSIFNPKIVDSNYLEDDKDTDLFVSYNDLEDTEDPVGIIADSTGLWHFVFVVEPQCMAKDLEIKEHRHLARQAIYTLRNYGVHIKKWEYHGLHAIRVSVSGMNNPQ